MKTLTAFGVMLATVSANAFADCNVTTYRGKLTYYNADDSINYKATSCLNSQLEIRREAIDEPVPRRPELKFDHKVDVTLVMNCEGQSPSEDKFSMKMAGDEIWTKHRSGLDRDFWANWGEKAYFAGDRSVISMGYAFNFEDHKNSLLLSAFRGGVYLTQEMHSEVWGRDFVRSGHMEKISDRACN